jgi:predicted nucleotidyltransferase
MDVNAREFKEILESLRKAVAALRDEEIRFALGGSVASWARGGPETVNDVDLLVAPEDAERAMHALEACGMRSEIPPEGWLYKLWDGETLVDIVFQVTGIDDVAAIIDRSEVMRVASLDVAVARVEDVLTPKLLAFNEHYLDYTGALRISRALREQIDWVQLRERTRDSPYVVGFFALCEALGIAPPAATGSQPAEHAPQVRVVS